MDDRFIELYTGEILAPQEEILLIKERIKKLQLNIDISEIEIEANKRNIKHLEDRLNDLYKCK